MRASVIFLPLILVLSACLDQNKKSSFEEDHLQWQKERIVRLKSKTGWLNLAGLYWLTEGENTIGSDSSNSIKFPAHAPEQIGKYILNGQEIHFVPNPGSNASINGEPGREIEIKTDLSGNATLLESGNLAWFVIERGKKYAIRLRDYEHPAIHTFHGIESFPADKKWKIEADFETFDEPKELLIPNVLGTMDTNACPGVLHFRIDGLEQVLYPTSAGKGFFIVFADGTSGDDSYGGGRFIYTGEPDKKGRVTIDFNRAYNPPCAFTPFATCPIPPRENILNIRIEAGEKFEGH